MNINTLLLHADPTASVHWLEHWGEVMILGAGLFALLMVVVWVYLKEMARRSEME